MIHCSTWFLFRLDSELARLRELLSSRRYRPSVPELITIRDPKPRVISRVPIADRVVHTALVLLMEPILLRSLSTEAYACRRGFGTHRAVLRLVELMRRHPHALHLDVRCYFPSIDRDILLDLLKAPIRDAPFLEIVKGTVHSSAGLYDDPQVRRAARLDPDSSPPGRGLPIGSHLSQLFAAHVYLNAFDHFVKRQLKVPGYLRYVDDLFLFGETRARLQEWRSEVRDWLWRERRLLLKRPRARVLSCRGTLDALGYRLTGSGWRPRPHAYRRLEKRVTVELGDSSRSVDFQRSITSSAGLLLF